MKNKSLSIAMVAVLSASSLFPVSTSADQTSKVPQTIEKSDQKMNSPKPHPVFTWDRPGPSSPVLHPGSIKGAGMVAEPLDNIDPLMKEMIANQYMPGAVTFVARRGHIVQHEAYGYAARYTNDEFQEMTDPAAMQKDTIFDIASLSKLFTTTAAMILYEQDKFELEDPVSDYLPEFAKNGKDDVTIQQLMTHTSGFPAWIPLYTQGDSREERLQIVLKHSLSNEPGTTYTYSDLNMITLGTLIERLSGQRLDEFVKEHITAPLKMKDTMYNPPASLKHRIAATEYQPWTNRGLVWGDVHDENAWSLDGVAGHAGVFSTAADLAKFAHMFVNEGRYGGTQLLQPETVQLLTENQIPKFPGDAHGLGWELAQGWYMDALSEASTLGHTGYTGTSMVVNTNNDTIAILLTNRVHPTRSTPSTNPVRRGFARQVADSIPVSIPDKGDAWFTGYGDQLDRTLTSKVDLTDSAVLSFKTWYRIEKDYDYGYVEVSEDGKNWTKVTEPLTGSSVDWKEVEVTIPADTNWVRFRYETDSYTNGRGWYVDDLTLTGDTKTEWSSSGWTSRNY